MYNHYNKKDEGNPLVGLILLILVILVGVYFYNGDKQWLNFFKNDEVASENTTELIVGDSFNLKYLVEHQENTENLSWTSSNDSVATVVDGEVTALSPGSVTITISNGDNIFIRHMIVVKEEKQEEQKLQGGKIPTPVKPSKPENKQEDNDNNDNNNNNDNNDDDNNYSEEETESEPYEESEEVYVEESKPEPVEIKPQKIQLSATSKKMVIDENFTLKATVTPSNATDTSVKWTSSNDKVVSVYNGTLLAEGPGSATITAETVNGLKATCTVTVPEVKVSKIILSSTSETITKGGSVLLAANIEPISAMNKTVTWSSSNSSIAKVDKGKVTGVGVGTATITASVDGVSAKATIKVAEQTVHVSSISITPANPAIYIGATTTLKATVAPSNATNKTVTWTSSDTSVATVTSGGVVKGLKTGSVTITAKADGKSTTTKVTIKPIAVSDVSISCSSLTLKIGAISTITATVYPSTATNKGVTWSSSNSSIASVDQSGKVKATAVGTANITVTTKDGGKKATCKVTVQPIEVTSIKLNKTSITLTPKSTSTITATVYPSNATNKTVTWTSSNTNVATVSNGKVTAKAVGTATITAKTNNGKTATAKVTVKEIEPTGITLDKTKGTLYLNSSTTTAKITATVVPANAVNKTVTWTSSNTNVATVSKGTVTAKGLGTATITAKTSNGKTATYTVTVKKKAIVVVTASQGLRMDKWYKSHTYKGFSFKETDNTLIYAYKSGSGICYQTYGEGDMTKLSSVKSGSQVYNCTASDKKGTTANGTDSGIVVARKKLDEKYKSNRKYIDVILIYTMPGNSLKHETCDETGQTGTITNARYKALTLLYYNSVDYLKGYYTNTKAYMVSHFIKDPSQNSGEKTRCKQGVSSAWKYYYSGEIFKNNLDESKIQYVDVFKLYVVPKSVSKHTMKWVSGMETKYSTTDGTHMDETTTKDYTPKMFNEVLKKAGL